MKPKKVVGLLIRVSTEDQARGESPKHHEERGRWFIEAKEWVVGEVYHLEAVSGKTVMEHKETKRMLKDIKDGTITGLVFSKLARLARNTKELLWFADYFQEHSADLVSIQESIDTSSPAGRLFYTIIAAMAQWEREEIVSRVTASIPVRAKMGKSLGGVASFGYRWEGSKDKQLVLDEKEAPIRRLVYEIFARTKRKQTTARELNRLGYLTRKGMQFSGPTVEYMLRDPTAKGIRRINYTKNSYTKDARKRTEYKSPEEWVMVECPAIISKELWQECNTCLDAQAKKSTWHGRRSEYLLAGLVRCVCEKKMYVFHKSTNTYICRGCNNRITVPDLDDIYYDQLKSFLYTEQDVASHRKHTETLIAEKTALLNTSQSEANKLKESMEELVTMRVNKELSREDFTRHYQPLTDRFSKLEVPIEVLQTEIAVLREQSLSSETVLKKAKDLYTRWPDMPFEEKRSVVEAITAHIIVTADEVIIRLSHLPSHTPSAPSSQNGGTSEPHLKVSVRSV